ncbi:unnamed protein product [Urochloa humidicola]
MLRSRPQNNYPVSTYIYRPPPRMAPDCQTSPCAARLGSEPIDESIAAVVLVLRNSSILWWQLFDSPSTGGNYCRRKYR